MARLVTGKQLPPLNGRIKELIKHFADGNVSAFVSTLDGISHQTLNRIFNIDSRKGDFPGVSSEIITAITKRYPAVNSAWVLKGEGEMLGLVHPENQGSAKDTTADKLAQALADQAKANKDHAEGYKTLAEAYKEMLELLRDMRKGMAQQADQLAIKEKVQAVAAQTQDLTVNLNRALALAEKISYRQDSSLKEIHAQFSGLRFEKIAPSEDVDSKADQNDGDGQKTGKHRAKRK